MLHLPPPVPHRRPLGVSSLGRRSQTVTQMERSSDEARAAIKRCSMRRPRLSLVGLSEQAIRDLDDDCEIIAQFELGKYQKQLDPTYHHAEYRVDFLIHC
jgi:hypothetical protein